MKLYEATAQLEVVENWIEEHADEILANGGVLTDTLYRLLEEAEGSFAEKAERVALKVRELQAEAEVVKAEAARLTQRAKTAVNAADSLKEYLLRSLEHAGIPTVKGSLVTVALQKNPPSTAIADYADLAAAPAAFVTEVPAHREWNKTAIKEAAKVGTLLPLGVHVVQTTGLRIR